MHLGCLLSLPLQVECPLAPPMLTSIPVGLMSVVVMRMLHLLEKLERLPNLESQRHPSQLKKLKLI